MTPWLRAAGRPFRVCMPLAPAGVARPSLRFTVDTPADLSFVRRVVQAAGPSPFLPLAEYVRAAERMDAGAVA